jgi:hypothetical protein
MSYQAKVLILGSILMFFAVLLVYVGGSWGVLWRRGTVIQFAGIIVLIMYIPMVAAYLRNYRTKALEQMRPIVRISREEYDRILHHIETVEPTAELLAALTGLALGLYEGFRAPHDMGWPLMIYGRSLIALMFLLLASAVYHDLHLRRWIARLLHQRIDINIFDPHTMKPIVNLGLRRSLVMLGGGAIAILAFSRVSTVTIWSEVLVYAVVLVFGLLDFLIPLLIIHRKMIRLRDAELKKTRHRLQQLYHELHNQFETDNLQSSDYLSQAAAALVQYETRLKNAHTWPFEPETVIGSLIGGALLPTVAWFLQRLLNRFVH